MKTQEKITSWACYNVKEIKFFAEGENGSCRSWETWRGTQAGEYLRMLLDGSTIEQIDNTVAWPEDDSEEVKEEWKQCREASNTQLLFSESQSWPACGGFWLLPYEAQAAIAEAYALSESADDFIDLCEQERNISELLDMLDCHTAKRLHNLDTFNKLAAIIGHNYGETHDAERLAALLDDIGRKLFMFKDFSACYYIKNEDPEKDDNYGTAEDYDYISVSAELYSASDEINARTAAEYLLDADHELTWADQDGEYVSYTIEKRQH